LRMTNPNLSLILRADWGFGFYEVIRSCKSRKSYSYLQPF
jgi:hypothetical protein